METARPPRSDLIAALRSAAAASKCHRCGCFRGAVEQLQKALPALPATIRADLAPLLADGASRMVPSEYDCLGCAVCWPADALNLAVDQFPEAGIPADGSCPTAPAERVPGWPPFPGNFRVLDAGGGVAICVLTSEDLLARIADAASGGVAIVGAVYTENLGLERIVANLLSNPNLTTLIVCGADSRQRVGHLPGQSLLSLHANGLDERGRIVGALGRRPVIRNLTRELVEEFRREIELVDRIGEQDVARILEPAAQAVAGRPRRRPHGARVAAPRVQARAPQRLVLDPGGYFVVLPDRAARTLVLEHYRNDGELTRVFEGRRADHLFATAIGMGLVTRLEHAAYLGKELGLAERALATGEPYVQDRAPEAERPACADGCGCGSPPPAGEGG